jgi:hypothetical protein
MGRGQRGTLLIQPAPCEQTEVDPLIHRRDLMLRARARRALDERQAEHSLFKFIALHQPRYREPTHMRQLADAFDRAMKGPVYCIIEAPSRHLKTSIFQAAAARCLRYRKRPRIAFCTYANDIAFRRSREVRDLAATAGVWVGEEQRTAQRFDPSKSVAFWQTNSGGQFVAGGRHGQWIGEGFDLILYDDPIKDPAEAESQVARDEAFNTFRGTLMSRREPGCSVFVGMQRWNDDDPIGRLKAWLEKDPDAPRFEVITLRAIEDIEIDTDEHGNERIIGGTPLCPWRFELPELVETASLLGDYFWPNFQQDVTPRGRRLFPELARYDRARSEGSILLISCDPGIDKKDGNKKKSKRARGKPDPSGLVVAWAFLTKGPPRSHPETGRALPPLDLVNLDIVWAEELWLEPLDLLEFLEELQTDSYPGAPVLLEEVGAFRMLELVAARTNEALDIVATLPRGSKLIRSLPTAAGARAGRVRVPRKGAWVAPFCKEMREFTGLPGGRDNRADALTQLFDHAALMLGVAQAGAESGGEGILARSSY